MIRPAHGIDDRRTIESLLDAARRRLHLARLRARVTDALIPSLNLAVLLTLGFLAWRWIGFTGTQAVEPLAWWWLVPGVVLAAAPAAIILGRAARRQPDWREVAERVDLAADDHNRIATALALCTSQAPGPFARAAIEDGLNCLTRLERGNPFVDPPVHRWRGLAGRALALALLWSCHTAVHSRPGWSLPASAAAAEASLPAVHWTRSETAPENGRAHEQTAPCPRTVAIASPSRKPGSPKATAGATPDARSLLPTAPASASMESGATSASPADGGAGEGQTTLLQESRREEQAERTSHASRRPPAAPEPRRPADAQTAQTSGSAARGQASGQGRGAARNEAESRLSADDVQHDDGDHRDVATEPEEANTQRGGVQPVLKDRQAAPSRDLGIASSEDGSPGTGRGGPTMPKKSRGTASLVLGTPIPDFVRGRLGPGTSKITRERVAPSPMPGEAVRGAEVQAHPQPEPPSARFELPSDLGQVARTYLVSLHSSDQPSDQPASASPARSAQEPSHHASNRP